MADLWIQVEVGFPRSKLVDAAVRTLGLDRDQAMGKLVRLWLAVMDDRRGGDLSDRSDSWIEEEVGWRGEPGQFARFVRDNHLDEHGMIRDWNEKYGKLDRQREQYRTKKRAQRASDRRSAGAVSGAVPETVSGTGGAFSGDVPTDVPQNASNNLLSSSLSSYQEPENGRDTARDPLAPILTASGLDAKLTDPQERETIAGFLRSQRSPMPVAMVLAAHLTDIHGPAVSTAVLALAVQEYAAMGEERFSARHFAGFVKRAEKVLASKAGRVALKHEQQHINSESVQRERDDREAREVERMAAAFERDEPERFAELRAQAERQCKYKGMMRDEMVRAALLTLIRNEVSNAA